MSEPVDVDASDASAHAPGDGSPLFTSVVTPPERPRDKVPRWVGPSIAVICIAVIIGGIAIGRTLGNDRDHAATAELATNDFPIVAAGQPTVIAYVDPKFPDSSIARVKAAATKGVVAARLPFEVGSSLVSRTVTFTATHRSVTRGAVLLAASLLDGMPHVLGVEAPALKHAPFCGVVPNADMSRSTRRLVDALIGLHLGEQDLEYYWRTIPGRTDVNSVVFQLRVDAQFATELSAIDFPRDAAEIRQRYLADREAYDATLEKVGHAINEHDVEAFDAAVKQSRVDRFASSEDLDQLREKLDLPELTCSFTIM